MREFVFSYLYDIVRRFFFLRGGADIYEGVCDLVIYPYS
jgi:hypothetical protein